MIGTFPSTFSLDVELYALKVPTSERFIKIISFTLHIIGEVRESRYMNLRFQFHNCSLLW